MSTTCVWIYVFVMCVIIATAGPVTRSVSSPTDGSQWVFIPADATNNDSWIPIPFDVLQKTNITHLQQYFKLVRMYGNGIFSNDSLLPTHDKKPPSETLNMIIFLCFSIIVMMLCIMLLTLELMQKRQQAKFHHHHGQTTHVS